MKLLLLDIETAPNTAYVWGLFKENIPLDRLVDSGYVLCWSAKWLGEKDVYFDSVQRSKPKQMLAGIHELLEEADAVIHYNGSRFDIPTLNKEFLLNGFTPPAPYKQIDLLRVVRKQFRFTSNKLDHVAKQLKCTPKVKHSGFQLWVQCMAGNKAAWKEMEEYNIQDVLTLEEVYEKLIPWISNHPSRSLVDDTPDACPSCGGKHFQKRGHTVTAAGKYERFQCQGCGKWLRGTKNVAVKVSLRNITS